MQKSGEIKVKNWNELRSITSLFALFFLRRISHTQMNFAVFTPLCTVRVSRHPIIILFSYQLPYIFAERAQCVHCVRTNCKLIILIIKLENEIECVEQ